MEAVLDKEKVSLQEGVSEDTQGKELMLASIGVAYTANKVLWDNLGVNKLTFMQYHQDFQKAYRELAEELKKELGIRADVGRYGIKLSYYGKEYIFSKDYITGNNLIAGDESAFANNLIKKVDLDKSRVIGEYLTGREAEEARRVVVQQFIILPTEQEKRLKEKLVTISLKRPKDWVIEVVRITEQLGLETPDIKMEKGDIVLTQPNGKKTRIQWKYDIESVKSLLDRMCLFWEKDGVSNRKPNNKVVRGGGITLVNLTPEQKSYREYLKNQVELAVHKSKKVSGLYNINFSNTTTSCYVDLTAEGLYDLKISIRDHEERHDKEYYRFYINAVGREEFSNRLSMVIDELVRIKELKIGK